MKRKCLSERTIHAYNRLCLIEDKNELVHELEKIFTMKFSLPALWIFKRFCDELNDDDIRHNNILVQAKLFYAMYSGEIEEVNRYYEMLNEKSKLFHKLVMPDVSYEEWREAVLEISKKHLGPIRDFSLTLGRPTILNGARDFSPQLSILSEKKGILEELILHIYGENGYGVLNIARAEYLYNIDECYEALVLVVSTIQFLNKPEHARTLFVALYLEISIMMMNDQISSAEPLIQRAYDRLRKDGFEELIPNVRALNAWTALYDNDYERINHWFNEEAPDEYSDFCTLDLFQYFVKLRVYLMKEKYLSITSLAMRLEPILTRENRYRDLCELHLLWGMSDYKRNDKVDAFNHIEIALNLSKTYRYDRLIGDESEFIYRILVDYEKHHGKEEYLTRVMNLARITAQRYPRYLKKPIPCEQDLSKTELKVVKLIAEDKSNQEIAELLNITLNTVKFHNKNIFKKLKVKNRRQAVKSACDLGLIVVPGYQS